MVFIPPPKKNVLFAFFILFLNPNLKIIFKNRQKNFVTFCDIKGFFWPISFYCFYEVE